MLPRPQGPSGAGGGDSNPDEARNCGADALGEPGAPARDSPSETLGAQRRNHPRGAQRRNHPPGAQRRSQPRGAQRRSHPRGAQRGNQVRRRAAGKARGTPAPRYPQRAWKMPPSRMTLLPPWDPSYEAWGVSCGPGVSFSSRTLCHPSFWPLYEAWGRSLMPRAPSPGHRRGQQASEDANTARGPSDVVTSAAPQTPWGSPQWAPGLGPPAVGCEDVFFLDPLLPHRQRVPLNLSQASWQAVGSLKLLLPRPIMAASVCPSTSGSSPTARLSEPELIALTGLLQMSQGEPRPSSSASSLAPSGSTDPAPDSQGPSHCRNCSENTDSSPARPPDAQCP